MREVSASKLAHEGTDHDVIIWVVTAQRLQYCIWPVEQRASVHCLGVVRGAIRARIYPLCRQACALPQWLRPAVKQLQQQFAC